MLILWKELGGGLLIKFYFKKWIIFTLITDSSIREELPNKLSY